MKAIGIDIGTSSIKVVEAFSTNKGVQILSFREHALGSNPAHDPELEILEFLQALAAGIDPTQTKVVMALRQEKVSIRHKFFPFNDKLKILKSLPFELEEDLPFSADTAIYDARLIRYLGTTAEVLAAATPRHRVQEMLDRFQSTGLNITNLSAEGIAFANCFERWMDPIPQLPAQPLIADGVDTTQRNLRMVIQLGHTHSLVTAFDEGQLVGVRSILWGGRHVAEAIARKYEIPYLDALNEMRTKAFILPNKDGASYDQIVFSDTIATQFRELGRELRLSLLEFETELGGKVQHCGITGGLAGVLHLSAFLTQLLEVPVNPVSFLDNFNIAFERNPTVENAIGPALGLAIEGLRRPRNPPLQFLRGEFAPQNESLQIFWATWGTTVKVVAASFVILFIYSLLRENLSGSLNDQAQDVLQQQAKTVAKLPAKQQNEGGVKKYIRDKRKRAQEMKALQGITKMNSALEVLKKITDTAPVKGQIRLDVQSVKIEDQNVSIEGTVGNVQERTALIKALTPLAVGGKITTRETRGTPGVLGVPFALGFTIDRGIER